MTTVYLCYTSHDEQFAKELEAHVAILFKEQRVDLWQHRRVEPGADWQKSILASVDSASIVILLLSADLLASDGMPGVAVDRAIHRHNSGSARVVPVLVRACDWKATSLGTLQALPRNDRPVASWDSRDDAWVTIVHELRAILAPPPPNTTAPAGSITPRRSEETAKGTEAPPVKHSDVLAGKPGSPPLDDLQPGEGNTTQNQPAARRRRERRRNYTLAAAVAALLLVAMPVAWLIVKHSQLHDDYDLVSRQNDELRDKDRHNRELMDELRKDNTRLVEARHPIALFGSGNVHAFLEVETDSLKTFEPLWIDTASDNAIDQIFTAFSYGRATQATNRGGAMALSSSGNKHLKDIVDKIRRSKKRDSDGKLDSKLEHNYFLSIDVARRPLILLYRRIGVNMLRIEPASAARDYPAVDAEDVIKLFSERTPEGVRRYVPEAGSGTREAFTQIIQRLRPGFVWPDGEPTGSRNLDDLGGSNAGAFFMIVSAVPSKKEMPSDKSKMSFELCSSLKDREMSAAAIVAEQKLIYSTFTLVMKVAASGGEITIQDPAECAVARAFIGRELAGSCQLKDINIQTTHIAERKAETSTHGDGITSGDVPEMLQSQLHCPTP